MKHILFVLVFTLSIFSVNAQETPLDNTKNSEIKVNALYLVLGAFEGTYEHLLNEESSLGASVFYAFDNDLNEEFYFSPYYRFFFGKKYASGFFLEGFGMLNSIEDEYFVFGDQNFSTETETVTDFALGIGLGGKWVTKRGIIGELNFGIGRNLFNSDESGYEIVGKFGITVGYRF